MIVDKINNKNDCLIPLSRNIILLNSAKAFIRELKSKTIEFAVLKGLYLAFSVYPDAGLRPMADLDLLVRRSDLDKISEILISLGYVELSPAPQREYGCDATFYNRDKGYIDIHWDLCQYERFKKILNITDDFWQRTCEFSLDGTPARTLSIEDHILYISLHHALVHVFKEVNGIYDLFYLIQGKILDWENIIDKASDYGIRIPLYYSLLRASRITGLKLPDFVLPRLRPQVFKKALIEYLAKQNNTVSYYLCQSLMMGSFYDSLRVLWRLFKKLCRILRGNIIANFRSIPVNIKARVIELGLKDFL